jgi:pyrroloquinoline quinone biosynthesis protein B
VRFRVLGSAAGGGFPQWNCGCANCRGLREGTLRGTARTQESLAVSNDGEHWFLLNASPEIRQQIESFPGLWPRRPRHSPIAGILLGNGDLDHCLGLLSLRESHPLVVYATEPVRSGFCEGNVLYRTLQRFPEQVRWRALRTGVEQQLTIADEGGGERDSGLVVTALPVPGKRPLHLEGLGPPSAEDNVGLLIRDRRSGRSLAYLSACGGPSDAVRSLVAGADAVFFDGTFWTNDEMVTGGLGTRRAEDMAHWPVGGAEGSLAFLAQSRGRRILIHVNNSNPLLRDDSPERAAVTAAGVEVAYDGMEAEV